MIPVPISDDVADAMGGIRVVIPGDPAREVLPCEYVVTDSPNYPGRPCAHVLVELDDAERVLIAAGARIWLTMDGCMPPWGLEVESQAT